MASICMLLLSYGIFKVRIMCDGSLVLIGKKMYFYELQTYKTSFANISAFTIQLQRKKQKFRSEAL